MKRRSRSVTVVVQRDGTTKTRTIRVRTWALRLGGWVLGLIALGLAALGVFYGPIVLPHEVKRHSHRAAYYDRQRVKLLRTLDLFDSLVRLSPRHQEKCVHVMPACVTGVQLDGPLVFFFGRRPVPLVKESCVG